MLRSDTKIKSFTDLDAWQKGHVLVLAIYRVTENFPKSEMFGLVSQMRRSVVSITSNIAEGFRRRSALDKGRFYDMAQASLTELQNQLIIARDIGFISKDDFVSMGEKTLDVARLIGGMIRFLRNEK